MIVSIRIFGKVQGVFFRKSVKVEADKLGLAGWVRNNEDGTVEIQIGGKKEYLEKMVEWCKRGPPLSNVSKVEVLWSNDEYAGEGFEII